MSTIATLLLFVMEVEVDLDVSPTIPQTYFSPLIIGAIAIQFFTVKLPLFTVDPIIPPAQFAFCAIILPLNKQSDIVPP